MVIKRKTIESNAIRLANAVLKEMSDCFGLVDVKVSKALKADMTSSLKVASEYMRHMNIYLRAHGHTDEDDGTYWYSIVNDYWDCEEDPSIITFQVDDEYMSSY